MTDADIVARATAAQTGMTGNSNFQNLPVGLATFKTDIESFSALISEALDGSKKNHCSEEQAAAGRHQVAQTADTFCGSSLQRRHGDFQVQRFGTGFNNQSSTGAVASARHSP